MKIAAFWDVTPCSLVDHYRILEKCAALIFRAEQTILKIETVYSFKMSSNDLPHYTHVHNVSEDINLCARLLVFFSLQ
jgi:hypothetical protein